MRFKTLFAAPAAIAAVLALPVAAPETAGFATPAQAQTSVSFSISTFYDDLAPHGSWVNYSNAYVFVPNTGPDWRPYTVGRWEYTDDYGWLWVSDEPFGWATTHYGRWGRADDIGWYWVPGRRWAPAWVSWKRSDDYVAWAPLPPDDDVGVSVNINVGNIPDPYWNVVPSRRFLEPNLRTVIIRDDRERFRIIERARPIGSVRIQNNIVVNNVIDISYVERQTRRNVRPIRVRDIDDPRRAGRRQGNAIAIFRGEAEEARDRRPRQVRDIAEIRRVRAERRANRASERQDNEAASPNEATGSTAAPSANVKTGTAQERRRQQRQNRQRTNEQGDQNAAGANRQRQQGGTQAEEQTEERVTPAQRRERVRQQRRNNAGGNQQNTRQRRNAEQPAERVQRRRQNNQAGQGAASRRNRQEQPANRAQRRRQNAEQNPQQQIRRRANQQQPAATERRRGQEARPNRERARQAPAERQQRRRGNQACDPATQNCP